jgi:hypothetical protein
MEEKGKPTTSFTVGELMTRSGTTLTMPAQISSDSYLHQYTLLTLFIANPVLMASIVNSTSHGYLEREQCLTKFIYGICRNSKLKGVSSEPLVGTKIIGANA